MALAFVLARAGEDDGESLADGSLEEAPGDSGSTGAAGTMSSPFLDSASMQTRPTTVLVTEDDQSVRATTREVLESNGYDVIEAADGDQALKILQKHPVDVMLLDLVMPRRDGLWLLEHIDAPPPVVIVFSAFEYVSEDEVHERAGAKVFQCVRKPASPGQLLEAVVAAIETSKDVEG